MKGGAIQNEWFFLQGKKLTHLVFEKQNIIKEHSKNNEYRRVYDMTSCGYS